MEHMMDLPNAAPYQSIQFLTDNIKKRRLGFIGHCWRSKDEVIHKVLLWEPGHGRRNRGWPHRTYVDQLLDDIDLDKRTVTKVMENRNEWRRTVNDWFRVRSTRWWWWWGCLAMFATIKFRCYLLCRDSSSTAKIIWHVFFFVIFLWKYKVRRISQQQKLAGIAVNSLVQLDRKG